MLIYYISLSILLIVIGHLLYEYYITHINKPNHVNVYNEINNHCLKISEDLSKEENNREQMKNDLKDYLKTCV
jgi:hypothetical protein